MNQIDSLRSKCLSPIPLDERSVSSVGEVKRCSLLQNGILSFELSVDQQSLCQISFLLHNSIRSIFHHRGKIEETFLEMNNSFFFFESEAVQRSSFFPKDTIRRRIEICSRLHENGVAIDLKTRNNLLIEHLEQDEDHPSNSSASRSIHLEEV